MAGEIKQKITLEGEKEYSAAIKEAQRNLKTLRSALKAETAELGSNATAQQKNEAKVKSLKSQIAEQEKIVKTYTDALEEVRKNYADNEDEIARWEQKLNNARTALANMKNEMDNANGSISDMSDSLKDAGDQSAAGVTATRSFAEAISDLGTTGSSIAEGIEGIFTGFADTIKTAASAVYEELVSLSAKANAWSDLAGFWNTTTDKVRQFEYAVNASGNTFDDFSSMVTKFAMADADKILQFSGVNIEEGTDDLENLYQVMTNLSKLNHEDQQSAIAGIFGGSAKNYQKIMDLLNDWGDIQEGMNKYSPEGEYGMTAEEIQQMNDLSVKLADIDAAWNALKEKMVAGIFGEISLKMAGDVQGIIDAFAAFMDADTEEEKEQALEDFKNKITEFFTDVAQAIQAAADAMKEVGEGLEDSEDNVLKLLGHILTAFSDALTWLSNEENWGAVKTAFESLIAVWAGAQVATAVANIASFAANIATMSAFKNWSSLISVLNSPNLNNMGNIPVQNTGGGTPTTTGGDGGTSAVTGTATGVAMGSGASFFTNLGGKLATAVNSAQALVGSALPMYYDYFMHNTTAGQTMQNGGSFWEGMQAQWDEITANVKSNSETFVEDWNEVFRNVRIALGLEKPRGPEGASHSFEPPEEAAQPVIEEEEDVALGYGQYTREQAEEAIQDWWDAHLNAQNGTDTLDEELAAQEWMEEVLGEDFGEAWSRITEELDKADESKLDDIPTGWYSDILDAINWVGGGEDEPDENGYFGALPGKVAAAITGSLNGVKVQIDGQTAGTLLAPYVSDSLGIVISNLIKF